MRGKKIYIVLLIILFVFFVVMFLLFGVDNIRKKSLETTIIASDNTVFVCKDASWYNVTEKSEFEKLNWQKYTVFSDNELLGDYLLWHDDKWYAFNDKKKAIKVDGELLAYSANHDIKVAQIDKVDVLDDVYIETALTDNDISLDTNFTSKYKVSIDYDNDGVVEDFYVISNVFSLESENKVFAIVFMAKGDKIYYIYRDVDSKKGMSGCKPFIKSFLDVDNDNKYEFILGCGRYSVGDEVDMLYKEDEGDFKILISN